jgi:hypothetical protein
MNVMDELRILYACLTAKENIKMSLQMQPNPNQGTVPPG